MMRALGASPQVCIGLVNSCVPPLHGLFCVLRRLINAIGACLAGADAVSMGIMAAAAIKWAGTENARRADAAVMVIQILVLVGEALFGCWLYLSTVGDL